METGKDHWEVLLRARAIENQAFVLAAAQCGSHPPAASCYGNAMVVDPWGVVLARAGYREGVVVADLDFGEQERIRQTLPAFRHRREDLFNF
jgi:predicted amidohydrolase